MAQEGDHQKLEHREYIFYLDSGGWLTDFLQSP